MARRKLAGGRRVVAKLLHVIPGDVTHHILIHTLAIQQGRGGAHTVLDIQQLQ